MLTGKNDEITINLLGYRRGERYKQCQTRILKTVGWGMGVITLGVFLMLIALQFEKNRVLNLKISSLQQEITLASKTNGEQASQLTDQVSLKIQIDQQRQAIKTIEQQKALSSPLLAKIEQMEIEGVIITEIDYTGNHLVLKGYSSQYSEMLRLFYWVQDEQRLGTIERLDARANTRNGEIAYESSWLEEKE